VGILLISDRVTKKQRYRVIAGMAGVSAIILATIVFSGGGVNYIKQNIRVGYINGRILGSQLDFGTVRKFLLENGVWLAVPAELCGEGGR